MNLKKAWIFGVVGYSILRAVIAWGLFRDYGVNPWIFAVIDIGTAIPYASAVAELPGAIAAGERRPMLRHLVVAVTTFLAPYAYIWVVADDAPNNLRGGLAILVVCLSVAAGIGLWKKTRNKIQEAGDATDNAGLGSAAFHHLFLPGFVLASLALWWWAPGREGAPLEVAVVVLFLTNLFVYVLEMRRPDRPDWVTNSTDRRQDLYYIITRVIVWGPLVQLVALIALLPVIEAANIPSIWPTSWPLIFRILLALVVAEFVAYVMHFGFHHSRFFWRFHATHHAQTKLTSARWSATHPTEIMIVQLPIFIVATLLGPEAVDVAGAVIIGRSVVLVAHANLSLSTSGMGWLFTTPEDHRRHHGASVGTTANYADVLIIFDRLAGTFNGDRVEDVGLSNGADLTLREQLLIPVRPELAASRSAD